MCFCVCVCATLLGKAQATRLEQSLGGVHGETPVRTLLGPGVEQAPGRQRYGRQRRPGPEGHGKACRPGHVPPCGVLEPGALLMGPRGFQTATGMRAGRSRRHRSANQLWGAPPSSWSLTLVRRTGDSGGQHRGLDVRSCRNCPPTRGSSLAGCEASKGALSCPNLEVPQHHGSRSHS